MRGAIEGLRVGVKGLRSAGILRVEDRVKAHGLGAGPVARVDGFNEGNLNLGEAGSLENN